jgi:hypothetical protein
MLVCNEFVFLKIFDSAEIDIMIMLIFLYFSWESFSECVSTFYMTWRWFMKIVIVIFLLGFMNFWKILVLRKKKIVKSCNWIFFYRFSSFKKNLRVLNMEMFGFFCSFSWNVDPFWWVVITLLPSPKKAKKKSAIATRVWFLLAKCILQCDFIGTDAWVLFQHAQHWFQLAE